MDASRFNRSDELRHPWSVLTAIIFAIFLLVVWIPVERAWVYSCFNNYDLGIYAQAISLLGWGNLNPWLSTRDIHLFNDHFDPVLFLAAPLRNVWHPSLVMIRVEMICLLLAAAPPLWLAARGLISKPIGFFSCALILLGPMTLDAAFYPAHPGTWSLAPLSWMLAFLFSGFWRRTFVAMILAFLCKEEYPAATLLLGLALLFQGHRREGLWISMVSGLWLLGVFVVRPFVIGPSGMYSDAVSSGGGLALLLEIETLGPILKRLLFVLLPASVIWFAMGRRRPDQWRFVELILTMIFVMVAVRLLGGYWGNHRSAPLSVMAAYLGIGMAGTWRPTKHAKISLGLTAVLLILPGIETGTRLLRGRDFKKHCPNEPSRLAAISVAENMIRANPDGPVLAEGNLLPRLVDLPGIAQIGATKSLDFKYFLTEKYTARNPWPLSEDSYRSEEQRWRTKPNTHVLIDNDWILLIRHDAYFGGDVVK